MLHPVFRILVQVAGPVCFGFGALFRQQYPIAAIILLIVGVAAVVFSVCLNEMAISRIQAQRILNAAVDFLRANGATRVRANFAARKPFRSDHLKLKCVSENYGKVEIKNTWTPEDRACAIEALLSGQPMLGAHSSDTESLGRTYSVAHMEMADLRKKAQGKKKAAPTQVERIRSVLCVPVRRNGKLDRHPIGVITFDDETDLKDSKLATDAIISAAQRLASRGLYRG